MLEHVRIGLVDAEVAGHSRPGEARRPGARKQAELERREVTVADPPHAAGCGRRDERPVDPIEQPRHAVSAARNHHGIDVVRTGGTVDLLQARFVGVPETLPALARGAAAQLVATFAQPLQRTIEALERQMRARRRDDLDAGAGRHHSPAERAAAKRTNQSIDPGFAIESRLTDLSTGCPSRIFFTGTSSFLPDIVRGTSAIA